MEKDLIKQLEKYCLVNKTKFFVISIIVGVVATVFMTALLLADTEDGVTVEDPKTALIISIAIVFAFWLSYFIGWIIVPRRKFKKRIKYFKSKGVFNYVLLDIQQGVKKFGDRVLIGKYCLMCKSTGLIVFFDEISSIYIQVKSSTDDDGHKSEYWTLKIDAGGKTYFLCSVDSNQQTVKDWADICTYLKLTAPNIQIK